MKILLVEDQPILADAISRRLQREGHATEKASSIRAARKVLAITNPQLVLLDLGLPDGDGASLLAELRAASFERPPAASRPESRSATASIARSAAAAPSPRRFVIPPLK